MYKCNVECNVNVELLEHGIYTEYYVILEAQNCEQSYPYQILLNRSFVWLLQTCIRVFRWRG